MHVCARARAYNMSVMMVAARASRSCLLRATSTNGLTVRCRLAGPSAAPGPGITQILPHQMQFNSFTSAASQRPGAELEETRRSNGPEGAQNDRAALVRDVSVTSVAMDVAVDSAGDDSRAPPPTADARTCRSFIEPGEVLSKLAKTGLERDHRPASAIVTGSLLGGMMIGVGAALMVQTCGGISEDVAAQVPGLVALAGGLVFPTGITMILLTGQELLTSNMMYCTLPFFDSPPVRKSAKTTGAKVRGMIRVFGLSGAGNLAGALVVAVAAGSLLFPPGSQYAAFAAALATKKCSLSFGAAFAKAVGANWLVNVAVCNASSTESTAGKTVAAWVPIMAFVTLGLEHSVANMFFVPLGILCGADIGVGEFLVNNLVPVLAGNFVGAAGAVAWLQRHTLMASMNNASGKA